jgi:hypothetical protein
LSLLSLYHSKEPFLSIVIQNGYRPRRYNNRNSRKQFQENRRKVNKILG